MARGFGFGHADVGQLRVGEQAVRNEPAARGPVAAGQVVQDDAKIVLADVRELRAAGTFARRPDVRGAGLQPVVDADVAARIQLDAGLGHVQPVGVGRSAGRHQDVGGFERSLLPLPSALGVPRPCPNGP